LGDRDRAYGDVVAAMLAAREAPATRRFDDALVAAVAAGLLDEDTARTLRWWQRAAVREVADHARTVLAPVFAALVESAGNAADAVAMADDAWARAGGRSLDPSRPAARQPAAAEPAAREPVEPLPPSVVAGPPDTNAAGSPAEIVLPVAAATDTGRADARGAAPATTPVPEPPVTAPATDPSPVGSTSPGVAPTYAGEASAPSTGSSTVSSSELPPEPPTAPPTDAAARRRLVVAGLTRTG
jgi:hypothetical protein